VEIFVANGLLIIENGLLIIENCLLNCEKGHKAKSNTI